ncbi:flavin reductase family protein [Microbacterium sp. C7(2022)]|uniref:flavin reductase family protein n=1 Tax=Microbacterium sp. C7(2022) TaxID=2992759 RepID=UPI00237ACE8B|nr:flavin reductase family protein [Microbacterium sp. C7(2022)]MDE0547423.1 flavin reductase family protein [Microbacterium sp. C7(2022)]
MPDVIDFDALAPYERYKMMASLIVPRPVAWVTTRSADGVANAAPFSMFAMVGEEPPLLMVSMDRRKEGNSKDSAVNIDATGEFVVHLADESLVEAMDACSAAHPPEVDELELLGIETRPAEVVGAPIIADAPVAFECELWQRLEIPSRHIYFGQVRRLHARDGLIDRELWRVNLGDYSPVGRFGASFYTTTQDRFALAGAPTRTTIDSL